MLELKKWNLSVGEGAGLCCMLGLNVLEDEALALEVAQELKQICANLGLDFIFKASFDKANRSSIKSYRGPGMKKGLAILEKVKGELGVPILTDIHELNQVEAVCEVADVLQVPAFLVRQTDLIVECAETVAKKGAWLHLKKSQMMAPWDTKNIIDKVQEVVPGSDFTILCERGTSFGYNNLVVDMLSISEMKKLSVPVSIDATHAAQLPGSGMGLGGAATATDGRRDAVPILAKAAVAAGADAIFLEFHPDPDSAKCDGPCCLALSEAAPLLEKLKVIHSV